MARSYGVGSGQFPFYLVEIGGTRQYAAGGIYISETASTGLSVVAGSAAGSGSAHGVVADPTGTPTMSAGTGLAGSSLTISISARPVMAAGVGVANVSVSVPSLSVTDGQAAGTGAVGSIVSSPQAILTGAAGTGVANAASFSSGIGSASAAQATGVAHASVVSISITAAQAVGTGVAGADVGSISSISTQAAGTGVAHGPAASISIIDAQAAGTGVANASVVSPQPILTGAAGVGVANTAALSDGIGSASAAVGTGVAHTSVASISITDSQAAGTGVAGSAIVSPATVAVQSAGTGVAHAAGISISITDSQAAGVGVANAAVGGSQAILTGAAGIGTANAIIASDGIGSAVAAQATGVANAAAASVSITDSQAVGVGSAGAAVVSLGAVAIQAAGTGAAAAGSISISITEAQAGGTGVAQTGAISPQPILVGVAGVGVAGAVQASVLVSGQAVGIGVAQAPAGSETDIVNSAHAVGVAQANLTLASVSIPAGQAVGTGSANAVTISTIPITQAVAGQAVGVGVANSATPANLLPNQTMSGAVVGIIGSGGVLPTGFTSGANGSHGVNGQVTFVGTVNGLPAFALRLYGTNAQGSTLYCDLYPQSARYLAASPGQTYISSISMQLLAGSMTGFTGASDGTLSTGEYNSSSGYLGASNSGSPITSTLTRTTAARLFSNPSTVKASPYVSLSIPAGNTVDATILFAGWTFTQPAVTSSVSILTGTAVGVGAANAILNSESDIAGVAQAAGVAHASVANPTTSTSGVQAVGTGTVGSITPSVSLPTPTLVNAISNSVAAGAVVGNVFGGAGGGLLPPGWAIDYNPSALVVDVVATGIEGGYPYVDIRYHGTVAGSSQINLLLHAGTSILGSIGQTWSGSYLSRIVGGTITNVGTVSTAVSEMNAADGYIISSGGNAAASTLSVGSIVGNSYPCSRTFTSPLAAYAHLEYCLSLSAGTVDITVRVAAPQFNPAATLAPYYPSTGSQVYLAQNLMAVGTGAANAEVATPSPVIAQAVGIGTANPGQPTNQIPNPTFLGAVVGLANANVVSTSFTDGQAGAPGVAGSIIISPNPMVIQAGGTGSANAVVDSESFAIGQAAAVGVAWSTTASVAPLAVQAAGIGTVNNASPANALRNPQATGASVGSPGVVPTYWALSPCAGISTSVVALGNIGGYNYIQVNWSGTNTSGVIGYPALQFEYSAYQPAVKGQTWLASVIASMISGSMAGVTGGQAQLKMAEVDSGSGYVNNTQLAFTPTGVPTPFSFSNTIAFAATAYLTSAVYMPVANGASINVTLQFAFPSLTRPAVTPSVGILAGQAVGVGVAQPTSLMGSLVVLQAVGTGSANSVAKSVLVGSAQAVGTGSANATLETEALVSAAARGTGSANAAITSISISASSAAALGSANSVAKSVLVGSAQAIAVGSANPVAISSSATITSATSTGSAHALSDAEIFTVAVAQGTGVATVGLPAVQHRANSAVAVGITRSVGTWARNGRGPRASIVKMNSTG